MLQIRLKTFETNSSSSHSLVTCDDDTWEKFLNNKLYFNICSYQVTKEWGKSHPIMHALPAFLTEDDYQRWLPIIRKEFRDRHHYDEDDDSDLNWIREMLFKYSHTQDVFRAGNQSEIEYFFG